MRKVKKISISYPPLKSQKGVPLLSQNRQFQWFNNPTYIYPMVPSYAASLLKQREYEVFWDDGIAQELKYEEWLERIKHERPDVVAMETKTPVVKRHWKIIEDIKTADKKWNPIVILFGDHVTALPEESLENSPVDFVITGGDYDFVLADLCDYLNGSQKFPPKGVWWRENNILKNTGKPDLTHDLNQLPFIDRRLTKWQLYAYKNGNYKYLPGTYTMAGRDCWWGRCTFCSWAALYPGSTYRTFPVQRQVEEVGKLITDFKVREIFDDSGCFPKGEWLHEFCESIIRKGYNKKVCLGCNMRVGALSQEEWNLMKKANFRFILIGLESVIQETLDRLNKGILVSQIEETVKMAKKAGLEPHITTMVGYPWETYEDAEKTINFARYLFEKGYIDSLQATIVVPYPNTKLFKEAKQNNWLTTFDWDDYDMKQSVWKSPVSNDDVLKFTQGLYKAALDPRFIIRKIVSIRKPEDVKFLFRAAKKLFAHIMDFK